MSLLAVAFTANVSATEIESGSFQVTSTGAMSEDIGFRPDYIEFITAQQIESDNFESNVATNSNCPQNVNGWSEGSVIFDSSGVEKQFTIGAFRNSDSTNDHRVASSTSHVIKNVYTGRNGGRCGELRISVTQPTSDGFDVNVESRYNQFDEIVRYKAYQFPDNMEFDAGMVKISSSGGGSVNTGFQPANIHIRAGQQISSKNIDTQFDDNNPEEDNTLGRSKGYVTLDSSGSVIDQQSIGTASSSDSTNAHRSIASDQYVLNTAYVGQDGNLFGRLRARVTGADSTGFDYQVDDKWSQTDDVFLYRAWGFSYYDFQIGYKVISDSNYVNWDSSEPNNAGDGEDCAEANWNGDQWNDMDCEDEPHQGLCEYPDGSYNTTSSMAWDDARDRCQAWGGHLVIVNDDSENQYIYNNFGNVWLGYYQPSGAAEPANGWKWVDQSEFDVGFEPDAIDIYAEQQISSINDEVVTPTNSGCENAGGWSNGYYETEDDRQWALSTGRTSDSQNSHWQGSTTNFAINNMYSGQNGEDCGDFQGEVTSTSSTGFAMDFTFDNKFRNNYASEMVYYRALDFRLAPPQIESIEFYNGTDDHRFGVIANVSEGSNDISTCEITAESDTGSSVSYSGTATSINSTYSQCRYEWIKYDDHSSWEDRHDNNDELLKMNVTVNASDVDGLSSQDSATNTFPNHGPEPITIDFINYTDAHSFNVSAIIEDVDADNPSEIESCTMEFSDGDGNTVTKNPVIDYSYGTDDQASCFYSNVSAYMPVPSSLETGFTPKESINVSVDFQDHHSISNSSWDTNVIPNRPPVIDVVQPKNGESVLKEEPGLIIQVTDPEGDEFQRVRYRDDISGDTIANLTNPAQQFEYNQTWGPLDLGTYYWEVEVWDKWGSSNVSNIKFERVISTVYRVQHQIDYDYSSLIIEDNGQGFFFFEADVDTQNRTVTTYLEGNNLNAEFVDTGSSQRTYQVDTGDPERFHVRVQSDDPGKHELRIVTEDDSVASNTTVTMPVYVRESVPESAEVPGLTTPYLALILLTSSLLYFALL